MKPLRLALAIVALLQLSVDCRANPQLVFSDLDRQGMATSFADLRGRPTAIVVWKASCGPCLDELSHLRDIASRAPHWRFVVLALDDADTAVRSLPRGAHGIGSAWIARDPPARVLATLNPTQPALPLTLAVDDHGNICARRVGLLGSDVLQVWSAQCSK